MANVAVVTALFAQIAYFPLNCTATSREETAELTFLVGGKFGGSHRNDTNAAECSRIATAVQFVSAAAELAFILNGGWQVVENMRDSPK